jgi:hypothetical protein
MEEDRETTIDRIEDYLFDIGSLFRSSATVTFVVEIMAVIVMLASLAGFYSQDLLPGLSQDLQILLFLVGAIAIIIVFLGAISVFIRFSRRISNAVIGPGIEKVSLNAPRVKTVVILYGVLVALMGITGIYIWYLIQKNILDAIVAGDLFLQIFSYALGAFVIALLVQIIIAAIGRSATKVIIEVLDADDSEFLD